MAQTGRRVIALEAGGGLYAVRVPSEEGLHSLRAVAIVPFKSHMAPCRFIVSRLPCALF
ncbi:hypothetical protein [Paracidovorax sp. MALMAid1276]|uniref:hypothetical protein n=1 Tax=Paracidovorax sp. MALMAid1276 TaxID=3411631 RepID=UPI003B9CF0CC